MPSLFFNEADVQIDSNVNEEQVRHMLQIVEILWVTDSESSCNAEQGACAAR